MTTLEAATSPRHATQAERLAALEPLLPKFRERRRMYDDAAEFPAANFEDLRNAGLLGNGVPKEYGGDGFWWENFVDYYDIYERIAAADSSTGQLYQIQTHGAGMLAWHSTPAQREKYLPDVARKGLLIASVGSEADPKAKGPERYRAELIETGHGYVLNAHKHFASLGPGADYYLIWTALPGAARYVDRQVFVLIPKGAPGVELIDEWDTTGMRATVSWAVKITDYEVSPDQIIGEPGAWLRDPRTFTLGYVTNHLGTAGAALAFTMDYVKERPHLANSEHIRILLGDMSSWVAVTRSALYAAAKMWEEAYRSGWDTVVINDAELLGLEALHVSKQVALDVTRRVYDICGARAAFRSVPLEAMDRDVRTFTLHFRDDLYTLRIADAILGGQRLSKDRYAGGSDSGVSRNQSTIPQA